MVPSLWRTWLSTSVLSHTIDPYQTYLRRGGYSAPHRDGYLHAVGHFAHWLTDEHLVMGQVNEAVVRRFVTSHLPTCQCPGRCPRTVLTVRAALGPLLTVLRAEGRIPAPGVERSPVIHEELERFTRHLTDVCGLAPKTCAARRWWVAQFLAGQFGAGPLGLDRIRPRIW